MKYLPAFLLRLFFNGRQLFFFSKSSPCFKIFQILWWNFPVCKTGQHTSGVSVRLVARINLTPAPRPRPTQVVYYWSFQGGSSVAVLLSLCVCGFICDVSWSVFIPHLIFFCTAGGLWFVIVAYHLLCLNRCKQTMENDMIPQQYNFFMKIVRIYLPYIDCTKSRLELSICFKHIAFMHNFKYLNSKLAVLLGIRTEYLLQ